MHAGVGPLVVAMDITVFQVAVMDVVKMPFEIVLVIYRVPPEPRQPDSSPALRLASR